MGRCSKVGEICSNYLPIVQKMQNILSVRRALYLYSACVVEESSTLSLIKGFILQRVTQRVVGVHRYPQNVAIGHK